MICEMKKKLKNKNQSCIKGKANVEVWEKFCEVVADGGDKIRGQQPHRRKVL